jgi:CBS domain containing-hemolysin-like protein
VRQEIQEEVTRRRVPVLLAGALALASPAASASFLSGEALDTAANVLSWVVILFVPLAVIALFLYVHVLPELIAERRQHPHKDSIKVLCMLSLFFGGLLWPFAWLWAYTKPIGYRAIYGTEKHDDHYLAMAEKARLGTAAPEELAQARAELAEMGRKGTLSPQLQAAAADMENRAPQAAAAETAGA